METKLEIVTIAVGRTWYMVPCRGGTSEALPLTCGVSINRHKLPAGRSSYTFPVLDRAVSTRFPREGHEQGIMVGTRSRMATIAPEGSNGGGDCDGTRLKAEIRPRTRNIDGASSSPLRRSNRSTKTSLERLPRPISSGGGGSDATHSKTCERPLLRSGTALRSSTRTSLETLPLPQPGPASSPVPDGDRSGTRSSSRLKGIAGARTNAELNALLGLDAAVSRITVFPRARVRCNGSRGSLKHVNVLALQIFKPSSNNQHVN